MIDLFVVFFYVHWRLSADLVLETESSADTRDVHLLLILNGNFVHLCRKLFVLFNAVHLVS